MKNKTTLSITLALGVILLSLAGLSSNVHAQFGMQPIAETGLVILNPGEVLVVSVASKRGNGPIAVEFSLGSSNSPPSPPDRRGIARWVLDPADVATANLDGDGAVSIEVPSTNSDTQTGVRVDVRCDRPQRCVVAGEIFEIVVTGGVSRKNYVGHVTLIKQ